MKKFLILVIFMQISMNITFAQSNKNMTSQVRTVRAAEISDSKFRFIFSHFQNTPFLELPVNYDYSFYETTKESEDRMRAKDIVRRAYPYQDTASPFYVNCDRRNKERNDSETTFFLIDKTTGNYIIGVVWATSGTHDVVKQWLVTFDFSGKRIDYLPIHEWQGLEFRTIEAQIHEDLTVDVQRLDFADNDYLFQYNREKMECEILKNLKGQRIDTRYMITTEGNFKKLEEIRYEPQIYTPEMLCQEKVAIRQRKEKRM